MTQERQDGWYWVRVSGWAEYQPALWSNAAEYWRCSLIMGALDDRDMTEIGPRIPSPDEPKDPDLLAVVAAAHRFIHAFDTNPYNEIIERRIRALRSALAKIGEGS